ncbi:DUF3891 family protein [Azospirillum sp. TSO35-2]|uniref:DUF3891 family protein n=1 Tax=Azospirillum sp. TSO35-2 TaxID=716796 RepID=UPI000D60C43E|nr:DUF3891 family protein [Azospirillum sp. TSO35-2]PWC35906.1 hypothetical protein TSO352_11845 [Azospirillum sp. TSO35-2]
MLFRRNDAQDGDPGDSVVAIPQPSHAWLSGQLLRAWGNDAFDAPSPREEVCLGAEQHDIGWLDWEAAPTLNPKTGRPHSFQELDVATHTGLWRQGVHRALAFGRYPALLVSLHANTIYGNFFDSSKATAGDAARVRDFLEEQQRFQRACIDALSADPRYADALTREAIERNRLLVATVDRLSLEIGWGVRSDVTVRNVPTGGDGRTELRVAPAAGAGPRAITVALTVSPWPFTAGRVEVVCEGRRLHGRFTDEAAMRRALDGAEPVTIVTVLTPR